MPRTDSYDILMPSKIWPYRKPMLVGPQPFAKQIRPILSLALHQRGLDEGIISFHIRDIASITNYGLYYDGTNILHISQMKVSQKGYDQLQMSIQKLLSEIP